MPAVVVTGARQAGKSTLVRDLAGGQRRYWNLDDWEVLDLARSSPDALVQGTQPVTIDEIQREPDLLVAVKREIDRRRDPGRFLLTGSSDLLLMRNVSESLAGRSSYLTLWPMTRRERLGMGACGIWDHLLRNRDADWEDVITGHSVPRDDWRLLAMRGGFPTPSIHMQTAKEREVWFEGYVRTYVERDLRQLSAIAALPDFRRLMRAICLRIGQLVNQTKLGRDAGLAQPTVHRWLNLLETSYLLVRVPAYAANRTKRLIKSPKFYWSDTGLAMHIAREPEPRGAHLENLVLNDLLAWRDIRLGPRRDLPLAHCGRRGGGLHHRNGRRAAANRSEGNNAPAPGRYIESSFVQTGIRCTGPIRPVAACGRSCCLDHARGSGCALVVRPVIWDVQRTGLWHRNDPVAGNVGMLVEPRRWPVIRLNVQVPWYSGMKQWV